MADIRTTNIDTINSADSGYDIVIVCTGNEKQAEYWQQRLESVRGVVLPASSTVLAVHEDWPGGAGNGLGTFYAYVKACAAAKAAHGIDIPELLAAGTHSVGLYHTAGKGTRLAPLPAAENNNKPGVKLPAAIPVGERKVPLSILESVIKQTGAYACSRKGRLSVYWGDQVFIPSVEMAYKPSCHADILCTLGPMASEAEWAEKGLNGYGLIAVGSNGAAQVEKVTHAQAVQMLSALGDIQSVGVSLGSFSLSAAILEAFVEEFKAELAAKEGKLDTDPHLWMPLTLQCADYCSLMASKGVPEEQSKQHHERMAGFMGRFAPGGELPGGMGLFGAVDIGADAFWWDYGQLRWYLQNNLLLCEDGTNAAAMRRFYGIADSRVCPDSTNGCVPSLLPPPLSCACVSHRPMLFQRDGGRRVLREREQHQGWQRDHLRGLQRRDGVAGVRGLGGRRGDRAADQARQRLRRVQRHRQERGGPRAGRWRRDRRDCGRGRLADDHPLEPVHRRRQSLEGGGVRQPAQLRSAPRSEWRGQPDED